jgi:uncharacterized membrane protein SpoIIM required for sporulation
MNTKVHSTQEPHTASDIVSLMVITLGAIAGVAALLICSALILAGQDSGNRNDAKASADAYVLRATLASQTLNSSSIE